MARYDVYPNPDVGEQTAIPFFLDVQNSYIDVETRVVIPLHLTSRFPTAVRDLNPELVVQGKSVVLNPAALGAVPASELRRPVTNIAQQQPLIQAALDTLFGGY